MCPCLRLTVVFVFLLISLGKVLGGTLTGSFASLPAGTDVNLTAIGRVDWVHWGLESDTSLNRKANVTPQITDFTILYDTNFSYAATYQYTDNVNGYSWSDGTPEAAVTNTTTGVYVVGPFNITETNGFEFSAPADTTVKTLKAYVGTYAARGRFQAILSDGSAPVYSSTALMNFTNGPGGVYTVTFAANSSGQTLTIRWTVAQKFQIDGNVTLQAAALDAIGANNPPSVSVTFPTNTMQLAAPAAINITASASDTDGTVSKVEFYNDSDKLGEATNMPYNFTWSNVVAGRYLILAKAFDNGGAMAVSPTVEMFVYTNGGVLNGFSTEAPNSVSLTSEGTWDWTHWGLDSAEAFNHKSGVARQISNFAKIGTNVVQSYSDNYTQFTWIDGDPTPNTNSPTGVFTSGFENGFQLTAPADTTPRTLKVYAGLYGAEGSFRAYLSDFSAPAYTATLSNRYNNSYTVYSMTYAASGPGKTLTVLFTCKQLFDAEFGNLTLQAATLTGSGTPAAVLLLNPRKIGPDFCFSFNSQPNRTYSVERSDALTGWQFWTNLTGNGGMVTLTNYEASATRRFYRVLGQ